MAKGTDEALITLRLRWAWAGLRDKKQQEMLQSTKWWPQQWSFPEPIEGFPWSHPHSESVFRSMICRPTPVLEFFTALAPARPPIPLGIKVDVGMPVIRALFHLVDTLFGCCCCYGRNMLTVLQVQEVAASINKLLQKRLVLHYSPSSQACLSIIKWERLNSWWQCFCLCSPWISFGCISFPSLALAICSRLHFWLGSVRYGVLKR